MDLSTVEAVRATADPDEFREGDAWLGGGTVLFSYGSDRLRRLLDLRSAGWEPWTVREDGLEIAATCTIAELYALPGTEAPYGILRPGVTPQARAAGFPSADEWPATAMIRPCCDAFVASFKIWNTSTVGGNVATALPAGPMISLLAGLDAEATIWGPGGARRRVSVARLVLGERRTGLAPEELIRSFHIPRAALESRAAFRRLSLSNLGRSGVLLIGRDLGDGRMRLTVTAATVRPVQLDLPLGVAESEVARRLEAALPWSLVHDDIHGLPEWRRDMSLLLAQEIHAELGAAPEPAHPALHPLEAPGGHLR
ncbi:FAD binding domain-containing protein [Brachybacterium sp. J153]|uniref:FAD binding domain-containing protein n=1 Tax=Brachybacterium sp. J153 TaxID=3116488 RepID=UPI002E766F3B|nr:FAD binding domain-containing protein [Brachybacterium sp. J153]MEE1619639.1 FAD binding domain-containing protein [Brachybacterium sp. J153]